MPSPEWIWSVAIVALAVAVAYGLMRNSKRTQAPDRSRDQGELPRAKPGRSGQADALMGAHSLVGMLPGCHPLASQAQARITHSLPPNS
jgi:hypothetical protein